MCDLSMCCHNSKRGGQMPTYSQKLDFAPLGQYSRVLRLVSKLPDLRTANANQHPCHRQGTWFGPMLSLPAKKASIRSPLSAYSWIFAFGEYLLPCRHLASGCRSAAEMRTNSLAPRGASDLVRGQAVLTAKKDAEWRPFRKRWILPLWGNIRASYA